MRAKNLPLQAVVAVLVIGLVGMLGILWWWRQPAPLPNRGMLGKVPVRYQKINDVVDLSKAKVSKYRTPRTPDQVVHEFFVAMNGDDWERFKRLTVGREEFAKKAKLQTEEAQHKMMVELGQGMTSHTVKTSVAYVIQHEDNWFVVLQTDFRTMKMAMPLKMAWVNGAWKVNLALEEIGDKAFEQLLGDSAQLEKLSGPGNR